MEKVKKYSVDLTLDELKQLDGKVGEAAQKVIDQAKQEAEIGFDLPVMNEILRKSMTTGTLTWTRKSIRSCSYCDKKHTYQTYARNSRHHNKGDLNYDKPLYYSGIAFNEGFVVFKGIGDMCWECCSKHNVIERLINYIIENDLKIQIQSNQYKPGTYLKEPIYTCKDCEKEFSESLMGRESAIFGGTYPSRCPHCNSKNTSKTDKFTFIQNPRALPEVIHLEQSVKDYNAVLGDKEKGLEFYQSNRNRNLFIVERRYSNRIDVLRFNTQKKEYKIIGVDPALEADWKEVLDSNGYKNG